MALITHHTFPSVNLVQRDFSTVSCIRITAIFYICSEEQSDKRLITKFLLPLDFFALKAVIPNIADSGGGEIRNDFTK